MVKKLKQRMAKVLTAAMIMSSLRYIGVVSNKPLYANMNYVKPFHSADYISATIEPVKHIEVSASNDIQEQKIEMNTAPVIYEEPTQDLPLSSYEIDLIALVTMAEAEDQPELGQRLVIDTILNRADNQRCSIHDVIYAPNQFSSVWNGRIDRCFVMEEIRNLVIDELLSRTNFEVLYFTADHYGKYGIPMFSVGDHYFCKGEK